MSTILRQKLLDSLQFYHRFCSFCRVKNFAARRFYSKATNYNSFRLGCFAATGAIVTVTGAVHWLKNSKQTNVLRSSFVLSAAVSDEEAPEVNTDLTLKRMKFEEYASYEFGGKLLMSPQDFLNSLVDNKDSLDKAKKMLTTEDVNRILKSTQQLSHDNEELFAHMGENDATT